VTEADVLGRTPVLRRTTQQIHGRISQRSTDNQDDDVLTVPSNNASLTATHFLAGGSLRVYCAKTEVAIRAQKTPSNNACAQTAEPAATTRRTVPVGW